MRLPRARRQWALVATAVINVVAGWRMRLDGQAHAYLFWDNGADVRVSMPLQSFTLTGGALFAPSGITDACLMSCVATEAI